jgi:Do/DeqQ family serine protease
MVAAAFLAAAATVWFASPTEGRNGDRETPVVRAVRGAAPAVVNISTKEQYGGSSYHSFGGSDLFDRFFQEFFDSFEPPRHTWQSLGSGVIVDGAKGYILTNHHVIAQASEVKVGLADQREFPAEIVGADPGSDLAVLQIQADDRLPDLKMGDSADVMIGETVIAIGNPFGLNHTVTTGVISAVHRSVRSRDRTFRDFIQTDASINPGNSGGPLLNINGELIGINSAIYDRAEGIGFAIPINKAKRIMADLISYGQVHPPYLGLNLQSLDQRLAAYFNAPSASGVVVTAIDPQSPAEKAGLQRGDVITRLDHHQVESVEDYEDILRGYTARTKVQIKAHRQGRSRSFQVDTREFPDRRAHEIYWDRYGLKIGQPDRESGAPITDVRRGSAAHRTGLKPGDRILRINEIDIHSRDQAVQAMARYRFREGLSMIVTRDGRAYRVSLIP